MIEILDEPENGIVRVAFVGRIESTDYERSALILEKIMAARKPLRLLVDWTELLGWDAEAESQSFFFQMQHRRDIQRSSIIAPSRWRAAAADIERIVDAEFRFFDLEEAAEALPWLRSH